MDRRNLGAILFLLFILGLVAAYWFTPLGEWLSIGQLKESRARLGELVAARPLLSAAAFFLLCMAATAACFPAAPILGVSGGLLFGFWTGLSLALCAQAIGSTLAFLAARHLARDWVERKLGSRLGPIDRGIEQSGALYLLALRFNPLIPYWLVNLAMGLTAMRLGPYAALTPIGLAPAMAIYVNAGTQLATIESASDIVSPALIAALLLLSLFPLIVKAGLSLVQRARA